jgi:LuxR family transcriptional regulator
MHAASRAAASATPPDARLDAALDRTLEAVHPHGFTAVAYDYSPVPLSHDGRLIQPTVLRFRQAPDEMERLWRESGYYQLDPVQDAALSVSRPFLWSYVGGQSEVMARVLGERHAPVVHYLRDAGLTVGITVPIRLAGGDLATFTVMRADPEPGFAADAARALAEIGLIGQTLHDDVIGLFDARLRRSPHVRLSPRERQCLRLCADGLTAKEIAFRLDRSIPTVALHLASATRKLGARNRFQAIARAAHYRLLDGDG